MDDPLGCEDEAYRTCAECGGDCEPEPVPTSAGMRIAFNCPPTVCMPSSTRSRTSGSRWSVAACGDPGVELTAQNNLEVPP